MKTLPNAIRGTLVLPILGLLACAGFSQAAVTLTGTVSPLDTTTGRYTYSYDVTNFGTMEEIITVVLPVSTSASLLGLTAPTGFVLNYDTFQGFVNFDWDTDDTTMQTFSPNSTVTGFSFTSVVGPGPSTFTARDINEDFTGVTTAPVPEPSATLLGLASLGLLLRRRR